jgi:hypothetical protein
MSRHWGKSIRTIFANHAICVRHPASAPAALLNCYEHGGAAVPWTAAGQVSPGQG